MSIASREGENIGGFLLVPIVAIQFGDFNIVGEEDAEGSWITFQDVAESLQYLHYRFFSAQLHHLFCRCLPH